MIAIHNSKTGFHPRWIEYCKKKNIPFKLVDCYSSNIIKDIDDCDGLMWHFHHADPKAKFFAKQLIYSLEIACKKVYPNFKTIWHFDDKVGQKYLLEAIGAPLVNTYTFYSKHEALTWINQTNFPKVFKLSKGSGSANVKIVNNKIEAISLVKKAFGKGFRQNNSNRGLKERFRRFKKGNANFLDLLKGIYWMIVPTEFEKYAGNEIGYIYFQDFIPNNKFDFRVVVIGNNAFAIKRMVREKDFRASGSGDILYDKLNFNDSIIRLSFEVNEKLQSQCTAFDFVFDGIVPKIVEISYGFTPEGYDQCPGYWDKNLNWYEGIFNPYGWMLDNLLEQ